MTEPCTEIYHRKSLGNQFFTLIQATRPAFLTASVLPVIVGLALSYRLTGTLQEGLALLTIFAIILIHSSANVLNDYFDAKNGSDDANTARIYPFTGGSRFIQNGVLTQLETRRFGASLMLAGIIAGLIVTSLSGPLLPVIGVIGGIIAVIYSAPPCLACKGMGDISIATTFGLLPVSGTVYIQTGNIPGEAIWLGTIVGIFVAAILWANSIPDIAADRTANKWTIPARLGSCKARKGLPVIFAAGFGLLLITPIPHISISMLAIFPASLACFFMLSGKLNSALPMTVVTQAIVCLLLTLGLTLF